MKKIAIYGLGNRCGIWHRQLMREYEVVCFVSDEEGIGISRIKSVSVISKEDLYKYRYDCLVILTDRRSKEIFEDIERYSVNSHCIFWLDDFLINERKQDYYEKQCVKKQKTILKEILAASDTEIHDYDWMYKKVIEYGLYCFRRLWLEYSEDTNWTVCGIQQIPEEFTEFCIFLSDLNISSAIDIGVYKGRSSYFVCVILMRKNPNLTYYLVDIEDRLDHFEDYQEILPSLCKRIPQSSGNYKGKQFDYVFIDADHTYDGSIADYENVGKYAKVLVAFHDIYAHEYDACNGGTVRTWKEVLEREAGNEIYTFSKHPNEWMGIGCVMKTGE